MAQNKDLKTKAQIQRELNSLLKQEAAMKAKIARYEKEGVKNIDEEKKAYADLKKTIVDFGNTAKKVNDGRTKEFKAATTAADAFGKSIADKISGAYNKLGKKQQSVFAKSTPKFGQLTELGIQFANSTEAGADKAAQLTNELANLQVEVMSAGAGFKNLSDDQAEALNKKIEEIGKSASTTFTGAFSDGADLAGDITDAMKETGKASKGAAHYAKNIASHFKISLEKADLLKTAVLAVSAAVKDAAENAVKFQQSLGVSNKLANQQIFSWNKIGLSFLGLNDDLTDANTSLGLAANNLDIAQGKSKNLSRNIAFIQRDTGASAETLATVNQLFQNSAGLTAEQASNLQLGLVSMSEMAGVIPGQVLADMASNSEMLAKFSDGTAEGMARAAIQAQKLGINLSKAGTIADSLLNLESSIANEFEASVLIGRDLNFDRARNLALNNDIEGAMKDIVDQLGSEEEFNNLNAIQRQALADSIGVGVEDLSAMVTRGAAGGADLDIGVKLAKQGNKTLWEILKQIGPGMIGKFATAIGAGLAGLLGFKGLSKMLEKFFPKGLFKSFFGKSGGMLKGFSKIIGRFALPLTIAMEALQNLKLLFGGGGGKDDKAKGAGGMVGATIGGGIGALLGGPIGAAIGISVGGYLGRKLGPILEKTAIGDAFKNYFSGISKSLAPLIDRVSTMFKKFGAIFDGPGSIGEKIGKSLGTLLVNIPMLIINSFTGIVGGILKSLKMVFWDLPPALAKVTVEVGADILKGVKQSLGEGLKSVAASFLTFSDNFTSFFVDLGKGLWSAIKEPFVNLKNTIVEGITSIFSDLVAQAMAAISAITDIGGHMSDIGGSISNFLGFSDEKDENQKPAEDFISRSDGTLQKFSPDDTVVGVKDPSILSALAGNNQMNDSGTKQVALLTTLVNNSTVQMAEMIKVNREMVAALSKIGTSTGA